MLHLNSKNSSHVIVCVSGEEWKRSPLRFLYDWMILGGPFSIRNYAYDSGGKLYENARQRLFEDICRAELAIKANGNAMLEVPYFFRVTIQDLDAQRWMNGPHHLRVHITDFKGKNHGVYTDELVTQSRAKRGLELTEVVYRHVIRTSYADNLTEPVAMNLNRVFDSIALLYEQGQHAEKGIAAVLSHAVERGSINVLRTMFDIAIDVSFQGVANIVKVVRSGFSECWYVRPVIESVPQSGGKGDIQQYADVVLAVKFTPTENYAASRHCDPKNGKNLIGLATTLSGLIDMHC